MKQSKPLTVSGWVLTALVGGALAFSAVMKLIGHEEVGKQLADQLGFQTSAIRTIGIIEIICVVLFAIPSTAGLGAILVVGYLGGAVAAHLRVGDPLPDLLTPVVIGVLSWMALWLRSPRVRAVAPILATRS